MRQAISTVVTQIGHLLPGLVLVDPTFVSRERQQEVYESASPSSMPTH